MILTYRPIDAWPGQLRKASERKQHPFSSSTTWDDTLKLLDYEVDMTANGGKHHTPTVLQLACSEVALRKDGQLALRTLRLEHPGVIVSFDGPDGPMRFSCDTFDAEWGKLDDWQANVRAIAMGLKDLRRITRYGLNSGSEQYRGFTAIGQGTPMGAAGGEIVLTVDEAARFITNAIADGEHLRDPEDIVAAWPDQILRDAFIREAYRRCHPDIDGSHELFVKLQAAKETLNSMVGVVDG